MSSGGNAVAAVVCGGVQWVMTGLLPHSAPAMHRESARHTSGWWEAALHLPEWYPLPALVASDTRYGVVFLKTEFIRKDVSAPMCQVAVSPLALLRGFPLNPLPHTAPMAAEASLNCVPEPWAAKALPQPPLWCACGRIRSSIGPDPALSPPCPPGKETGLRSPKKREPNRGSEGKKTAPGAHAQGGTHFTSPALGSHAIYLIDLPIIRRLIIIIHLVHILHVLIIF